MITLLLTAVALGFLQIAISYRHAMLFAKHKVWRLLLVSLSFALIGTLMSWLAFLFVNAIRDTMIINDIYAAMLILFFLAFKNYTTTRRSKSAENIFDITSIKVLLYLSFASSFEIFLATLGIAFVEQRMNTALIIIFCFLFFFSLFGLFAGKRPKHLKSIRVFILFASFFYLLAAMSTIYFLF